MESASRTLVMSPPELWEVLDQPERMQGLMSSLLGHAAEIKVFAREDGTHLGWEADDDGETGVDRDRDRREGLGHPSPGDGRERRQRHQARGLAGRRHGRARHPIEAALRRDGLSGSPIGAPIYPCPMATRPGEKPKVETGRRPAPRPQRRRSRRTSTATSRRWSGPTTSGVITDSGHRDQAPLRRGRRRARPARSASASRASTPSRAASTSACTATGSGRCASTPASPAPRTPTSATAT